MKIVNSLPEEKWHLFVKDHPQGNIFHTPEMFRVFSRAKAHQPELWAVVDDENNILSLMTPVHVSLGIKIPRILTTRSIIYGGILSTPGKVGVDALELLLESYKKKLGNRSLFTEIRNVFPLGEMRSVLNRSGFQYEDHLNYLITVNCSQETLLRNIGSRTRKNIRHGLNQGTVVIQEVTEQEQILECYQLLSKVYSNAMVPLADYSLFDAAFDLLYPRGMLRMTLAKVRQAPAAVSMELLYKDMIYGWYGGIDRKLSSFVPNELLMWNILKWGADNGYSVYDFGGAGKPGEKYGVRDFKAKFGGTLVCFGRNTWVPNPIVLSVSKMSYSLYRRIFIK